MGETIMAAVNGVLNGLKATFLFIWNGIKNSVEMAINAIRNIVNIVLAVLKGDWGAAWDGIKKLFTSVGRHEKGEYRDKTFDYKEK